MAFMGDASLQGYAFSFATVGADEVRQVTRVRERWRFTDEQEPIGDDEGHSGWGAGLAAEPSCGQWGAELLDWTRRSRERCLRARRRRPPRWQCSANQVEIDPGFAPLPDSLVAEQRWSRVVRGAWSFTAAIHLKEVRVARLGLRRAARSTSLHCSLLLSISDSMPAALSFEKGRSRDPALRSLVARSAAYSLGCRLRWRLRYIETARNATDHDSRAADRGEIKAGSAQWSSGSAWRAALGGVTSSSSAPAPRALSPDARRHIVSPQLPAAPHHVIKKSHCKTSSSVPIPATSWRSDTARPPGRRSEKYFFNIMQELVG